MKVKFNQFKTKLTRNSDSKGSNIMKKNRKLTALLVAACMTIPMAATTFTVPMMASGATVTIEGDSNYNWSQIVGFRVFTGTYNGTNNFTVTGWGDKIKVKELIEALKEDTTFWDSESSQNLFNGIEAVNNATTASSVADIISKFQNDGTRANAFARLVAANLTIDDINLASNADIKNNGQNSESVAIQNVEAGYYVLLEWYAPSGTIETGSARTLGLLKVVGGDEVTVSPKRSYPTINKEVKNEDTYGSVAD